MSLSEGLVKEFQEIYQNSTGKEIDFETASRYADDIAEVFYIIAKIDRKEKYE